MIKLRLFYLLCILVFIYCLVKSSKTELIEFDFLMIALFVVGFPLMVIPFIMIAKANKFYRIAESEGRIRKPLDRSHSTAEEEYKTDAKIITTLLGFLFIIVSYHLMR